VVPTAYTFPKLKVAAKGMLTLTRTGITPYNISFVDGNHLRHMEELGARVPPKAGAIVSVAMEGVPDEVLLCDRLTEEVMGAAGGSRLSDEEAEEHWKDRAYEFRVKRLGPGLVPGSVFVPAGRFEEALDQVYNAISDLGMKAGITGLLADRNTVDILPYYIVDDRKMLKNLAVMAFMKRLSDIALAHGGRPVGVGMWFAQNLGRLHGEGANVMRQVKKALDPDGLMNPGKVVEVGTRYGLAVPATAMNAGLEIMGLLKRTLPSDTDEGELGGPGGLGWRELKERGDSDAGEGEVDGSAEGDGED
jgi:FAD/FMN-containing dehydrogenase